MFHPFPYQTECLTAIETVRQQGAKSGLVVMASGLGKTVTVALEIKNWLNEGHRGRVMYLCHNNDILSQAKTTFEAVVGGHYTYGFFHGQEKNLHQVNFLFASFSTMEKYLRAFDPKEFDYIVVDESHHSKADTHHKVIRYFEPRFLLGVTATPNRHDKRDIRETFGSEIYHLPLVEALARNLLTPIDYRLMSDEIVLDGILDTPQGKLSIKYLNRKIFVPRRDEEIAKIIDKHVADLTDPRVIIFCSTIKHCDHFCSHVPNSLAIHSKIPIKDRSVRLELFRQGIVNTIVTVDSFNEGIDIPETNVVVFLRSTASENIFLQQLGRGLRKSVGKDKVIVLDFIGNCERINVVSDLVKAVKKEQSDLESRGKSIRQSIEPMTINIDQPNFSERIVQLTELLNSLGHGNFYTTWQEASEATIKLGIKSSVEYKNRYKEDNRLPASPYQLYLQQGWVGWGVFLGTRVKKYPTIKEASQATIKLNISTYDDYQLHYKLDSRLPACPNDFYKKEWKSWPEFLGIIDRKYPTLQEASLATSKLGIKTYAEYKARYKEDSLLPSHPNEKYLDQGWKGWPDFFGKRVVRRYPTYEEASKAVKKLKVRTYKEYHSNYKKDPLLPSNPDKSYQGEGWKNWREFLGNK